MIRAGLLWLGESVTSHSEARAARDTYLETLDRIRHVGADANVSLKLTQMGLEIDERLCIENVRAILAKARSYGSFVRIDMEQSAYTEKTLQLFKRTFHPEFANAVGVVLQSYLRRTEQDVEDMIVLGARVRLCKGAYQEPATVAFPDKRAVDANYVRCMERLLERADYPGIVRPLEQPLHAADVVRVHGALVRKRDRRGLLIRALAEPYAGAQHDHVFHVLLGASQIRLQHDADGVRELRMDGPLEQLQRLLGVGRLLHVKTDERPVAPRFGEDRPDVLDAQPLVDLEPHLGELQRHVRVRADVADAVEGFQIRIARSAGFGVARHRLAEQIEARGNAHGVEPLESSDRGLDRFTRDEARGEAAGEAVASNEAEDAGLLAEPQQAGADHYRVACRASGIVLRVATRLLL